MRRKAAWIAATAVVLAGSDATAQITGSIPEGARVRVTAPFDGLDREIGTVALSGDEGMVVTLERDGTRVRIPNRSWTTVEVSGGRRPATAYGAAIGAAVGLSLAIATLPTPDTDRFFESGDMGGDGDVWTIVGGGLFGAAAGAILGSRLTVERWRPVPWIGPWDRSFGALIQLGF